MNHLKRMLSVIAACAFSLILAVSFTACENPGAQNEEDTIETEEASNPVEETEEEHPAGEHPEGEYSDTTKSEGEHPAGEHPNN